MKPTVIHVAGIKLHIIGRESVPDNGMVNIATTEAIPIIKKVIPEMIDFLFLPIEILCSSPTNKFGAINECVIM